MLAWAVPNFVFFLFFKLERGVWLVGFVLAVGSCANWLGEAVLLGCIDGGVRVEAVGVLLLVEEGLF